MYDISMHAYHAIVFSFCCSTEHVFVGRLLVSLELHLKVVRLNGVSAPNFQETRNCPDP